MSKNGGTKSGWVPDEGSRPDLVAHENLHDNFPLRFMERFSNAPSLAAGLEKLGRLKPQGISFPKHELRRQGDPDGCLRILHVLEASGGVGRHVVDVSKGLAEAGHDITVIYSPLRVDKEFLSGMGGIEGVKMHALPMRRSIGPRDLVDLWKLKRLVEELGPFDVIHGHSSKAGALIRLLPTSVAGVRVYSPHALRAMDPELGGFQRMFFGSIERLLSDRRTTIIAGSSQEAQFVEDLKIPARSVPVLKMGISVPELPSREIVRNELGLTAQDKVIGFVGRFVNQKAPERAIHALAQLEDTNIKLVMVGYGELEHRLRQIVAEEGLEKRVLFPGVRDGQKTMPAFDLYLQPSRYESLGYALVEAIGAGTPVICTPVGVAVDIPIDGCAGIIVENSDDPEPWAAAISRLLDPEVYQETLKKVAIISESRPEGVMIEEIIRIYQDAIAESLVTADMC